MAFLRKSKSDKVNIKFKEVDFLVANIQFTNQRFLLERTEMMILGSQGSKTDVVHHKLWINTQEMKPFVVLRPIRNLPPALM